MYHKMKKTPVTSLDIKHIAKLANITLTPGEEKKLAPQLASILNYVSQLQKVTTDKVEPTSQVTGIDNVFREDEIDTSRSLTQEQVLANATASHNGYIRVKAVFEG